MARSRTAVPIAASSAAMSRNGASYRSSQPAQVLNALLSGMLIVPGMCAAAKSAAGRASTTRTPFARASCTSRAPTAAGRVEKSNAGTPSLFTRFISAKYFGGSGCPSSTARTNRFSSAMAKAQLNRRSYPTVLCGTADSPLPHAEPAPCPGQICSQSG